MAKLQGSLFMPYSDWTNFPINSNSLITSQLMNVCSACCTILLILFFCLLCFLRQGKATTDISVFSFRLGSWKFTGKQCSNENMHKKMWQICRLLHGWRVESYEWLRIDHTKSSPSIVPVTDTSGGHWSSFSTTTATSLPLSLRPENLTQNIMKSGDDKRKKRERCNELVGVSKAAMSLHKRLTDYCRYIANSMWMLCYSFRLFFFLTYGSSSSSSSSTVRNILLVVKRGREAGSNGAEEKNHPLEHAVCKTKKERKRKRHITRRVDDDERDSS